MVAVLEVEDTPNPAEAGTKFFPRGITGTRQEKPLSAPAWICTLRVPQISLNLLCITSYKVRHENARPFDGSL